MDHLRVETELWIGCLNIAGTMSSVLTAALEDILNLPSIYLDLYRKITNDAYRLDTVER